MGDEGPQGSAGPRKGVPEGGNGSSVDAGGGRSSSSSDPRAARIAAAKATALAAAAPLPVLGAGVRPAAGAGSPTPPLSSDLQAFAAEVQAAVSGLEPDALTVGLPAWRVARERLLEVCRSLRQTPRPGLDYLTCLTGVDYPERVDVVYHIFSIVRPGLGLVLKVAAPKMPQADASEAERITDLPWLPSVTGVWPGAEWHEREVFDLLGVRFEGHPDLRRILTPEGFSGGYPLRKDYVDRREQRARKIRVR